MQKLRTEAEGDDGFGVSEVVSAALDFYGEDSRVQCARYEGLAGTRAGMTLFYTDLVAKLWESTDFGRAAPILAVPGFRSAPHQDLPMEFRAEMEKNRAARIWFGPRANSVSRRAADGRSQLLFEHRFTRVYAASRDPANPGKEGQPREDSRRTLGWWERHFDDIADYEQEYHRQNQIMKWAMLTDALEQGSLAQQLAASPVRRDLLFADWHLASRASLRFAEGLPPLPAAIPGRECIPILSSYSFSTLGGPHSISGGVSTVSRGAAKALPPLREGKPLGARKAFVADLGQGTAGSATRARPLLEGRQVVLKGGDRSATVSNGGMTFAVPLVSFEKEKEKEVLTVVLGRGKDAIGKLQATRTREGTKVDWTNGPVEAERVGAAASVALTVATGDRLAKQGIIIDAARVFERSMAAAPAEGPSAMDLARQLVVDLARHRPRAVLAKVEKLAQQGKALAPDAKQLMMAALNHESPAAAALVKEAIAHASPLDHAERTLRAERGHVVVYRDADPLPLLTGAIPAETDLSKHIVFLDGGLRTTREGFLPEVGGQAASWQHQRGVSLTELDASAIGAAPDRLRETATGATFERVGDPPSSNTAAARPRMFVLRKCDAEQATSTTGDDCPGATAH
jgi:hypothetical protein